LKKNNTLKVNPIGYEFTIKDLHVRSSLRLCVSARKSLYGADSIITLLNFK